MSADDRHDKIRRLPPWIGYLLIAADLVRRRLFLVPWAGTMVALFLVLPDIALWAQIGLLATLSVFTFLGILYAVMQRAEQHNALGAQVAWIATQTRLGRWLLKRLDG